MKLYKCQVPDCERKVQIRSKIKSGEHRGKYVCKVCKDKHDGKKISTRKFSKKKKEVRECLPDFFKFAIRKLRMDPTCQNCGQHINHNYLPTHNIAHILSKRRYESVMCNHENFIILCAEKDKQDGDIGCHRKFDDRIEDRPKMKCFEIAKEKLTKIKDKIKEKGKELTIFALNN